MRTLFPCTASECGAVKMNAPYKVVYVAVGTAEFVEKRVITCYGEDLAVKKVSEIQLERR